MDVTLAQMVVNETTATSKLHVTESLIAIDPQTPPQVLHELACGKNWELRRLVASNPNTPTETLWQLGIDFPETILANPIFELLQLEHLHLAAEIPHCTLTSLLQCDRVPRSFMDYAVNQQDYSLWLAVAYNPRTPSSLLENLAQKSRRQDRELIRAVAAHPHTPPKLLAEIINISSGLAEIVAENHQTPVAVLEQILQRYGKSGESTFTILVALHPHLNPRLLREMYLAPTDSAAEALWLAKQPSTTTAQLTKLARTDWAVLLLAIVRHPNTPSDLIDRIWLRLQSHQSDANHRMGTLQTIGQESRLIYDSFVCNPNTSQQLRGELRKLLQ